MFFEYPLGNAGREEGRPGMRDETITVVGLGKIGAPMLACFAAVGLAANAAQRCPHGTGAARLPAARLITT